MKSASAKPAVSTKKKVRASFRLENELHAEGFARVAGVDEVGRGAWAGPLVAAAVILPPDLKIGAIFESKLLTAPERAELAGLIKEKALGFGIGAATPREIIKRGMTYALQLAYVRALEQLESRPDMVLLDGRLLKEFSYEHRAVVGGDRKSKCIAAASVVAKEYRDTLMIKLSATYPEYAFHEHKGYGTVKHQRAILDHGVLPLHRTSFKWFTERRAQLLEYDKGGSLSNRTSLLV